MISIGGLLGILLGVIASMGAAGFLAGYLGRFHYSSLHGSVIYGFVTWSLILLISALCAGPMAHYVSSYGQALSQTTTIETPLVQVKDDKVKNSSPAVKTEDNSNASPTPMVVTPTELVWGGWVIFLLFFVGALSCCIGAGCGMQCKCEKTLD